MKPYVKPELYFESFELAQHIAGCNLTLNDQDGLSCAASGTIDNENGDRWNIDTWFLNGNASCKVTLDSYCYTNGSITNITVNS